MHRIFLVVLKKIKRRLDYHYQKNNYLQRVFYGVQIMYAVINSHLRRILLCVLKDQLNYSFTTFFCCTSLMILYIYGVLYKCAVNEIFFIINDLLYSTP